MSGQHFHTAVGGLLRLAQRIAERPDTYTAKSHKTY